jgi:hypothetical protein
VKITVYYWLRPTKSRITVQPAEGFAVSTEKMTALREAICSSIGWRYHVFMERKEVFSPSVPTHDLHIEVEHEDEISPAELNLIDFELRSIVPKSLTWRLNYYHLPFTGSIKSQ